MFRIRRRFALTICGICCSVFLILYFFINNAAPNLDKKPNLGVIATKLEQLEKGLQRHGREMYQLKNRLENGFQPQILKKPALSKNKTKTYNDKTLTNVKVGAGVGECTFDLQQVPQTDVQMLDLYTKMSFEDIDGGVWKQGWNILYDPLRYNEHHKLKVFVVPHSHNDPGWIKTFDDYYEHDTKHILSNALRHLRENIEMKFIWSEISYFARFYEELGEKNKDEMKRLVKDGQLEFVSGGWVMPDEANSHWLSILLQLTEGQKWLKKHFNITPTASWAIDPFGHSASMPYILKKSGFKNMLIQRTHYSVKKELAKQRQLEFYWRQLWDDSGATDLFTHMMPFYSYDIPHTCGPDPKICCQFDFKRMPGFGLSCPWRVPPTAINEFNVASKAELIIDQWKKKAELYRSNVLFIPLGDDFRYSQSTEWDAQRKNYQTLFDHINGEHKYFVEVKFGTLHEYFAALHREKPQIDDFPTLSGDFFTYADRSDDYWSGYYTSRPYHKRMDRVLLHYVRSAEILNAWNDWGETNKNFELMLQNARRELSLFQHHDGITGTAKNHVVIDYARRMLDAIKSCRIVMQQSVYKLLTNPEIYQNDPQFNYFYLDDSRWPGPDDSRTTIILGEELPTKYVVLHNSLTQWREELVEFYVSSPYISVIDFNKNFIKAQITPVWSWHKHTLSNSITPQGSGTKYRLLFKARVPPLGLVTYIIKLEKMDAKLISTTFAKSLIMTNNPTTVTLGDYPLNTDFAKHRELSLRVGKGPKLSFGVNGYLKSIQPDENSPHMPINVKFYKYKTNKGSAQRSGAYLFMPNGPATPFIDMNLPVVLVVDGPLESSVSVGLSFVIHQTILRGDNAPEIRNLVDIGVMDDTEIIMRFQTHIKNDEIFYTDLNGLQMIKRQRFKKIPIQANYYPIPTAIYIEDNKWRLSLLSAQPLGGSSLSEGEVEIMQDRRLSYDDERGLGQGVLDNQPVLHIFRLVLETIESCVRPADNHPAGVLTLTGYQASKSILNPIDKFIYSENDWLGVRDSFGAQHKPTDADVELVTMQNLAQIKKPGVAHERKTYTLLNTGIIVHRTNLLECPTTKYRTGMFDLRNLLQFEKGVVSTNMTTLTFLETLQTIEDTNELQLCPMDTKAFIVQHHSS